MGGCAQLSSQAPWMVERDPSHCSRQLCGRSLGRSVLLPHESHVYEARTSGTANFLSPEGFALFISSLPMTDTISDSVVHSSHEHFFSSSSSVC
jgi:hypothetical protein